MGERGVVGVDVTPDSADAAGRGGFAVHLDNFEGPFDLLLSLIARHQLDVTEVALAQVTDDFVAHVQALGPEWDLDQTTEFLVVAATLLDLKAARLLPQGEVEDPEDLALLEARDLLFARLLQYRAYQQVAGVIAERLAAESRWHPREVTLEDRYAAALPEVVVGLGAGELAALAERVLAARPAPAVPLDHLHAPAVSVREQAAVVAGRLRQSGTATFRSLSADARDPVTTVARFLALLELFREGVVSFEQAAPLGDLHVRWTGPPDQDVAVSDEFDQSLAAAEAAR